MRERRQITVPATIKRKHGQHGNYLNWPSETYAWVRIMAGFGMSHAEIANAITPKCTPKTLRERFAPELEQGGAEIKGRVGKQSMIFLEGRPAEYERDKDGRLIFDGEGKAVVLREEIKPNVAMAIFLCKVRLGLKETNVIEQAVPEVTLDLTQLSESELRIFEALLAKVTPSAKLELADGQSRDRPTSH